MGYAYNPSTQRGEAVSSIQSDLNAIGIETNPKTIRKWLKEAVAMVNTDYWDQT
jgi:hypothetical protein